ncbi:response regulator [Geodermatophilus ruber]|uniref:Two component transcriptional regulator, LuxR family n=1 Tax=Geodermatophilus ruber TaxID=504800 RepID=A0A1I4DI53_9ACTN|nr:response regulator transcription factor [Geodermatophilus ruber]SFK91581.1 two component transcriptional regulator, LuxR family [Geodermatophilus ruber]
MSIRVFLVDDHRVVRDGMRSFFELVDDIEVVGEAADGRAALDRLAVLEPAGELPDVVLMDLLMPALDGIETTRELKARWPAVEVVAVTSFLEEAKVRAALEAGAGGYLLKDAEADDVAAAVRAAARGDVHLAPAVARELTAALRAPRVGAVTLTPREREVLALIADGRANREIATALQVSERTARTHVSNILAKLGLASRTQAAMYAVREGLVRHPAEAEGGMTEAKSGPLPHPRSAPGAQTFSPGGLPPR